MSLPSELTYTPAWWVPGGHLQTLWGKFVRRASEAPTRCERWQTPDGDELELRRLDATIDNGVVTPRLLVLHGLEGTIRSHYLRGILAQASARGWAADVLLFRSCNGEMNRTRRMYHSGETSDLDFVVRRLISENPGQAVTLVGFSLGGNVLLKWLGEQGDDAPSAVRAAVAVSVPFDLARGARHLERGFSRIYARHFLKSLRAKAVRKLSRFPDLFDPAKLSRASTIYDFDDAVTAPVHGFRDALDYYNKSSSLHYLQGIRRPTLLISAKNDPFLPPSVLDDVALVAEKNSCLRVDFPELGGHVGFVSGTVPFRSRFYAEARALEFLARESSSTQPRG